VLAGFFFANNLLGPRKKVLLKDVGLKRASGLAGYDKESFRQINLAFDGADLCGIS
jgi:hypothetical protein